MNKYLRAYRTLQKNELIKNDTNFIWLGHLVSKEKPKKVKMNMWRFYECPVCRNEIEEVMMYCPHCGQRIWIDRGDEDER